MLEPAIEAAIATSSKATIPTPLSASAPVIRPRPRLPGTTRLRFALDGAQRKRLM